MGIDITEPDDRYIYTQGGRKKEWFGILHKIKIFYERMEYMNILIWILMIVGGAVGIASTAYLVLAMPFVFGCKVYRKAKYHIGLFD